VLSVATFAQKPAKTPASAPPPVYVASTPAYAELLLRSTELESELESLLLDYTEEYPRVKEIRHTVEALKKDIDSVNATKESDAGRLSLALGRLLIKRADLDTELWNLLQSYKDEHPDVKRARRKLEIYDNAIKQILR
jgi:uncharacterized protein involved in exopolysaccharide biosynthesis